MPVLANFIDENGFCRLFSSWPRVSPATGSYHLFSSWPKVSPATGSYHLFVFRICLRLTSPWHLPWIRHAGRGRAEAGRRRNPCAAMKVKNTWRPSLTGAGRGRRCGRNRHRSWSGGGDEECCCKKRASRGQRESAADGGGGWATTKTTTATILRLRRHL